VPRLRRHEPWSLLARGFLMGSADLVPGVSGGTVALVTGVYEELIDSISTAASAVGRLARLDVRGALAHLRQIRWLFILPLGLGILAAILLLSSVIDHLLETQPVRMSALFFGLVAASVVLAVPIVRRWDAGRMALLLVVAAVAAVVLGLRSSGVSDPSLLAFFLAGAVAICAMILPGISGSFILLMLGMYDVVLAAASDRDLGTLTVFALGCGVGLLLFSKVLDWSLEHHHDTVVAGLIGLMLGSLRVLWPWPNGTESTTTTMPQGDVVVPIAIAVAAFVVVVGASRALTARAPATEAPGTTR
jgi:putative membrane protein